METILILATAIAILVNAFVQVVKITLRVNDRFLPITALMTGAAVAALAVFVDADLIIRMWAGAIAGLMSVGLFENAKHLKSDD